MATSYWDNDIPYERLSVMKQAAPLEKLVGQAVEGFSSESIQQTQQAARVWAEANGDRERAHTTGVALGEPRHGAETPRLIVYVDSSVLLSDFRTNTNLYLERLALYGLEVSGLDFRLSHNPQRLWHTPHHETREAVALSEEDREELARLVAPLPEELREKVHAAALSSLTHQHSSTNAVR